MLPLGAPLTWAQSSGGSYTLRKVVIAGGSRSSGAPFSAIVTTAQPVAGVSNGGPYRLRAGFHPIRAGSDRLFCSGFETTLCP